jgi:ABC-type nitrate/sulfonate/bicarbonate transport system substrate-binding protein
VNASVEPAEARRLLANVRKATRRSERARATAERRYQQALARANEPRRQAILACFDAKIPRKDVAEAADVTLSRLYQLVSADTPEM